MKNGGVLLCCNRLTIINALWYYKMCISVQQKIGDESAMPRGKITYNFCSEIEISCTKINIFAIKQHIDYFKKRQNSSLYKITFFF